MLKLKYLFNNTDLAEMLLKNWKYDPDSLELFSHYRISSNAVYPFRADDEVRYLRFTPATEVNRDTLEAQHRFISYLRGEGYGAVRLVESLQGQIFHEGETPWGTYIASVQSRAVGTRVDETDLSDVVVHAWGKSLGRIHKLSSMYKPEGTGHRDYSGILSWMENELKILGNENGALNELSYIREKFSSLEKNRDNYGLIHYDFEADNLFYAENPETCNVIDFDDFMYHWYAMDLDQALDNLLDEGGVEDYERREEVLLDGYSSEFRLPDLSARPLFRRFANLYGYTRIKRSINERWDNEPDWLADLRIRLGNAAEKKAGTFAALPEAVLSPESE